MTGPTWEQTPPPELTLGNAAIDWAESGRLLQPDGPRAGDPWRFTDEQTRFVLNFYAIDETGRFLYRNATYRRMKGAGKNPFSVALACVEFVGPCRFGGWDERHRNTGSGKLRLPLAVAHHAAWVQCAGVSKDSTRNTMPLFPAMFSKDTIAEYDIDLGKELIYAHAGRCRIEAVTSSPFAIEGARATFIVCDETHHWLANNEGHAMRAVIERNAAKSRDGAARVLSITNAYDPGEDSVAQRDHEAFVKIVTGRSKASGVLYDCREAPPEVDLRDGDQLRAGLLAARGDAVWLDIPRLMNEIWDPRTDPSVSRRYYLNQIVAAEDAWCEPREWDLCASADSEHSPMPGEEITLGFDGALRDDHAALVGCRVSDSWCFTLGIWDPEDYGDKEIPMADVDLAVRAAFASYLVDAFFSDVHPFESYIDRWEADFGEDLEWVKASGRHAIAWDMRGRQKEATQAAEAFHDAIVQRAVVHSGDRRASQYVYNARRRPNPHGVSFGKESRESARKVDWLAAAMLARLARQQYLTLPENRRRRKRSGRAMFL